MDNQLIKLRKRINDILKQRELPENIKEEIKKVYQEYKTFYEEYIKTDINSKSEFTATRNFEEYFEENFIKTISDIDKKYKDRCDEIIEVAEVMLPAGEISILQTYVKNDKTNYMHAKNIVEIVINSIEKSKNEMFKVLERVKTDNQKIEYINEKIELIKNTIRLKLGELKTELDIDDEQILNQILAEYEEYKNGHQKFVSKYKVSEDELNKSQETQDEKEEIQEKVNDNPTFDYRDY